MMMDGKPWQLSLKKEPGSNSELRAMNHSITLSLYTRKHHMETDKYDHLMEGTVTGS